MAKGSNRLKGTLGSADGADGILLFGSGDSEADKSSRNLSENPCRRCFEFSVSV